MHSGMYQLIKLYFLGVVSVLLIIVAWLPSHFIRRSIYRFFGMKIGHGSSLYHGCEVRSPWKISIGVKSVVGENVLLDGRRSISIGDRVNISSSAWIWTLHHSVDSPSFKSVGERVVIGDYVWLCSRSTILPGVSIGEGAVVAAGAVVTKDVAPYEIVAGVPAKKIGVRKKGLDYNPAVLVPFI